MTATSGLPGSPVVARWAAYFKFLDRLRESGVTNMYGAVPLLHEAGNIADEMLAALEQARAYLKMDMDEHGLRVDYADTNSLNAIEAAIAKATGATP